MKTNEKFDALCSALRTTRRTDGQASREAARLVLMNGLTQAEAARITGVSKQAVHQMIRRLRRIDAEGCPTCKRPMEVEHGRDD